MAAAQDVTTRRSSSVEQKPEASSTESEQQSPAKEERNLPMLPVVDIFEDAHQITVQAEMQGCQRCTPIFRPPSIDAASC